ncbi:MAG: arsenate-mycothiol transferase ArsC [Candidatus Odinarchaeia archaeon]
MVKKILFVCIGNSARSQMAEAFFNYYNSNPNFKATSAGVRPADRISSRARLAMKEKNIELENRQPKKVTNKLINEAYRIIVMGSLDDLPDHPPNKTTAWNLKDTKNATMTEIIQIRDQIEENVKKLLTELN